MLPWEHAAVGYIGYSLFVHALYRDSPTGLEAVVVVFASVLPDLIDKPLAWELGVFPSGYALGHSILFAVPFSLAVGALAARRGGPRIGWAFGIGYLLHLPADVIPIYLQGGGVPIERILWPIRVTRGNPYAGFWDGFDTHIDRHPEVMTWPPASTYEAVVFGLLAGGLLLWIVDGMPVLKESLQVLVGRR